MEPLNRKEPLNREVILLHTNDIHSHLDNLAKVETGFQQFREAVGKDNLVLIDLGDFMDRMSFETEGSDGLLHRDLLNYMQYEVITLGNNECLSFTHDQLTAIYEPETTFQVVCCNMQRLNGAPLDWLLKSTIIEKNGLKLGFVGATINYTDYYRLLNWNTTSPIEAIKIELEKLRPSVDAIIVLSHLGIKLDEQLVDDCPQIDVLIGAHTHHVFDPPIYRGTTLMCAAGMGGKLFGSISISKRADEKHLSINGQIHSTEHLLSDVNIRKIIRKHHDKALNKLGMPITNLTEDLLTDDFNESDLPNLLALSLQQWCNTSLAIVNSGQLLYSLKKGHISLKDLHATCPAPINPCILHIRGKYIREAFEQSLHEEYKGKKIKGYGFRGKRLGYLAIAGFKVEYDYNPQKNTFNLKICIKDCPINDEILYKVASIDMFTFKQGYPSLAEYEEVEYLLPEYLRHILAKAIQQEELLELSKKRNWINRNR